MIIKSMLSLYKLFFSRSIKLMFGAGCRFYPTCSEYAKGALDSHGVVTGSILSVKRLAKCNPWGGYGYDPVPKSK